ncbi:hypothetical protein IAD21_01176 [Abditibacteriota bacterium]|nr:hypothetical protein IAD21_01176 [Abditibacteriota bacterium]
MKDRILSALEDTPLQSYETLGRLGATHRAQALEAAGEALDSPNEKTRRNAVTFINQLEASSDFVDRLIVHLLNDKSAGVRFSCAVSLMRVDEPSVDKAYIQALHDSSEKIIQLACVQLGFRGGDDAKTALFQILSHPSWNVRLAACKAFITLKTVDERVLSALETMSREPESAKYDAGIDESNRISETVGIPDDPLETWGKMATIIEEAHQIAANQHG